MACQLSLNAFQLLLHGGHPCQLGSCCMAEARRINIHEWMLERVIVLILRGIKEQW
jgi:hypothetical protein